MKIKQTLFGVLLVFALILAACSPTAAPTAEPAVEEQSVQDPVEVVEEPEEPELTPEPTEEPTVEPESEPMQFTDLLGREVILEKGIATRIVSLSPSTTEILFAIGAGDQVIGRDEASNYPEEALEVTDIGSMWEGLPSETILALEPDLVLAGEVIAPESIYALEELGLTVYQQANPVDFDGLYANIQTLGEMAGHVEAAEELATALAAQVSAIEDEVAYAESLPLVFYELDATEPDNPWTTGGGTFISLLIETAGGANLGSSLDGEWVQVSSEEIINQNPDIILLADAPYGISPESVAERPGWSTITAVQQDQVYPFDPYLSSVPGPRMVQALEEMAKLIHPELFE
ncbi:MAG: ABC transporter substrate-binding protein [Anaerolineales bacterium]|nr:ABC transporter substrate-binding protein [Anaerolineales bacterium]